MTDTTPAMAELDRKRAERAAEEKKRHEYLDSVIPHPVGWSVLIVLPKVEEAFDSGLIKADETQRHERILSFIGLVLELGDHAYKDERYGGKPWCKPGDYVMFRPNSGTRFKIDGTEYRLLNDDSVEAVVPDPKVISSAR
jgi:co-chaperonin GroES (HSP10)